MIDPVSPDELLLDGARFPREGRGSESSESTESRGAWSGAKGGTVRQFPHGATLRQQASGGSGQMTIKDIDELAGTIRLSELEASLDLEEEGSKGGNGEKGKEGKENQHEKDEIRETFKGANEKEEKEKRETKINEKEEQKKKEAEKEKKKREAEKEKKKIDSENEEDDVRVSDVLRGSFMDEMLEEAMKDV